MSTFLVAELSKLVKLPNYCYSSFRQLQSSCFVCCYEEENPIVELNIPQLNAVVDVILIKKQNVFLLLVSDSKNSISGGAVAGIGNYCRNLLGNQVT